MDAHKTYTQQRARELLLTPDHQRKYYRLLTEGDRGDYSVYCPACLQRIETYETEILKHIRTCEEL